MCPFFILARELNFSQGHFHRDGVVWCITNKLKILKHKFVDVHLLGIDLKLWKRTRFTQKLFLEWLDVVCVHVRVSQAIHKIPRSETTHLRNHAGQQTIGCQIKWDTYDNL